MHPPVPLFHRGDGFMEVVPVEPPQRPPLLRPIQGLSHEGSAQSPPRHDAQVPVLRDPTQPAASESASPASQTPAPVNSAATTALPSSRQPETTALPTTSSESKPFSLSPSNFTSSPASTVSPFASSTQPSISQTSSAPASEASSTAAIRGSTPPHNISFYLGVALAAIAGLSFLVALFAWWLRIRRPRKRHRQPLYFPFPEHPPKKPPSVMTEAAPDTRVPQLPSTRRLLRAPRDTRPPLRRLPTALQLSDASVPALTHDIGTPRIANLVSGDILFSDSSASASASASASRPASAAPSLLLAGDNQGERTPRCIPPVSEGLPVAWTPSAGVGAGTGSSSSGENTSSDSDSALPLVRPMTPKTQRGTWAGALRTNLASAFNIFSGHSAPAQAGIASTSAPQDDAPTEPSPSRASTPEMLADAKNDSMPGKLISPFSDAAASSSSSDSGSSRYSVASDTLAPLPPTMHRDDSVSSQTHSSDGDQAHRRDEDQTTRRSRPSLAHLHSSFGTSATSVGSDMTRASSRHGRLTEREEAARRALRERRKRVSRARIEALREKNERLVQARVEAAKA